MSDKILISVWSDYVCPFCYLEEPVLEQLELAFGAQVEVDWRAFELRPDPVPTLDPNGEYLRTTWARSVYPMAAQRGMTLRLPPVQPRSRLALEAERFARRYGLGKPMRQAFFRAFFERGRDIGDIEVVLDIGGNVGIDVARLRVALENGEHAEAVSHDQRQAQALGISGVPALLMQRHGEAAENALLLSGAQPFQVISRAVSEILRDASSQAG
ncbi:DSBA oxidoreductase [Sulfuriferula plumbiphila]|uniref:DSBA oxidoreductase n=1 Tax=Sulfuriferula plumbiphila TaxID=171865 RepID=A0A512L6K0_9PROT|nr:DsbA family oxidoreductase [Sulfuriferula plumbiphila]BBP04804.1 DSBA oxidoreductase [Sulfuriferula plumbiphila]GEP30077.1 DSBA oxidoreductase [Sulfuriferula plumbiphila]